MMSKERLEEIKNSHLRGIHSLFGTPWVSMPKENFDWLIEQAERVSKHETRINNLTFDLASSRVQNKRYKQALEFYAERDNYQWEVSYRPQQEIDCMVIDDSGHTARKALEGDLDE